MMHTIALRKSLVPPHAVGAVNELLKFAYSNISHKNPSVSYHFIIHNKQQVATADGLSVRELTHFARYRPGAV
jgi:hypothetical protein